eukprot:7384205-Prymnesium_polylepis.1
MPAAQRDLLLWLLEFLAACADHAASSKMGVEQLAVCFAPLVVHSVEKAPQARARARWRRLRCSAAWKRGREGGRRERQSAAGCCQRA